MTELKERIGKLSPEKQKLLEMLAKKKQSTAAVAAAPAQDTVLKQEAFPFFQTEKPAEKTDVRNFYNKLNLQLNGSPYAEYAFFLNFGYVANDNPQYAQHELPENYLTKNPTKLVLEVVGDCPMLPHFRVLDVGCGRGGTVHTICKFFDVAKVTGMDLSNEAVAFCQQVHKHPNCAFQVGDAEQIPFEDESFDVITNLESSHSYPDIYNFYRGVHRVLKPWGHFLYTDAFGSEVIEKYEQFLRELGMEILLKRDITSNVLLSCNEVGRTHYKAFEQQNDWDLLGNVLAVPNSDFYNKMRHGEQKYLIYKIVKKGN